MHRQPLSSTSRDASSPAFLHGTAVSYKCPLCTGKNIDFIRLLDVERAALEVSL